MGIFSPDSLDLISIQASEKNGGGEGWVTDMLIAWLHNRESIRAAGLFDNDSQGKSGKEKVIANQKYSTQPVVRVFLLKTPQHLHGIFQEKLHIGVCLEELLSPKCWIYAKEKGWLTKRRDLLKLNSGLAENFSISVNDALSKKKLHADSLLYLENEVAKEHKESLSKYVARLDNQSAAPILAGFEQTIMEIVAHLIPAE